MFNEGQRRLKNGSHCEVDPRNWEARATFYSGSLGHDVQWVVIWIVGFRSCVIMFGIRCVFPSGSGFRDPSWGRTVRFVASEYALVMSARFGIVPIVDSREVKTLVSLLFRQQD